MTFPLDNFIEQAKLANHSPEYIGDTSRYISNLTQKGLPVIFSLQHLCLLAHVNIDMIENVCDSGRMKYYKRFKIKKKRGGYRIIQSPEDSLKYIQKWILINILDKIASHDCSKGFDKGACTKVNAEAHLGQKAILKIDLCRFYDSVNERRVYGIFKAIGYHSNLAVYLAKICTVEPDKDFLTSFKKHEQSLKNIIANHGEGILPQGAPTSPKLSNLIARRLDIRLSGLAKTHNLKYSRYADDITFSGEIDALVKVKKIVYKAIGQENLFVNHTKTKFIKKGGRFFITGLSVNNEIVSIPRRFKKNIEHHLFYCIKNGVQSHLSSSKIKNRNFKDWLLGNIAYVFSVEKEVGQRYFDDYNKIQWPI